MKIIHYRSQIGSNKWGKICCSFFVIMYLTDNRINSCKLTIFWAIFTYIINLDILAEKKIRIATKQKTGSQLLQQSIVI